MSSKFDKLLAKGKAKVKELQNQQAGPHPQAYPAQQYPPQNYPPNQYQQFQPYQQNQQNQPYPPQNQQYPPHNQQWGPPPNQWGSPPPQQQQQWGPPPPQSQHQQHQQSFAPPIPLASKPQSPHQTQAPPLPQNRPAPPPPQDMPPPPGDKVYWKPSFDDATPVFHNFRHEIGDHGWGNEEKQMYTDNPANSFHHDHRLVLRALVQNQTYTSARLTSHQTLSRPRGYVTATILAPVAEGIWPAYWMLPKDPCQWPNDGEVDIFESWNGDCMNHSCLHWGHYNGEDWNKHRVIETHLPSMPSQSHTFGFAWTEEDGIPGWRGRMIWYIDGRPVMKGNIPLGTRRMEDFRILINIAMGGKVCHGKLPRDGYYDMIVSDLEMRDEPPQGGWQEFERVWNTTPEGKTM